MPSSSCLLTKNGTPNNIKFTVEVSVYVKVLMNTFYANQQYGSKCWLCDSIDVVKENRRIRCHFGL